MIRDSMEESLEIKYFVVDFLDKLEKKFGDKND
jgi:hypothetical protein